MTHEEITRAVAYGAVFLEPRKPRDRPVVVDPSSLVYTRPINLGSGGEKR